MIYLILLLLITHLLVLYLLKKYVDDYKENNHNFITSELRKINSSFTHSIQLAESNMNIHYEESNAILKKLERNANNFSQNNTKKFNELTSFIKSDYHSLTQLLKTNNELIHKLTENTKINITKNKDLKPLLESSSDELEKVYGKIKMLVSNYEKSLKDIKIEIEDVLSSVEKTTNDKIKQMTANGEKTISETVEVSKEAITYFTESTNKQLSKVLKDNQIKILAEKVQRIDDELKLNLSQVNKLIIGVENTFKSELIALKKEGKRGFFGF
ncbi:MAG: hypothetical protein WBB27_07155 [Maribacter sp.]